ncbi:MAG: hypothetical protein MUO95_02105, partial [Methanoregula sp.]|nr:hypothetical protein [Methanoregula sp.]
MGGETERSEGGSTVKGKRTPVLRQRTGNSSSITEVNFTLDTKLSSIDITLETYMRFCNERTIVFHRKEKRQGSTMKIKEIHMKIIAIGLV